MRRPFLRETTEGEWPKLQRPPMYAPSRNRAAHPAQPLLLPVELLAAVSV
jgi:hypothetical protein